MDINDVDRHQGNNNGVDQDDRLGGLDDSGCNMDEQDEDHSSDDEEADRDDDDSENDEEGNGDKSKMEQLGFSEL